MSAKNVTTSSSARAVWTTEMIEKLLQLRLGPLLARFSRSRAPTHLQDAWNELHDEFVEATGVVVPVTALKNKFQQLKREFEETHGRLMVKHDMGNHNDGQKSQLGDTDGDTVRDDSSSDDDDDDSDSRDDPTLPPYWRVMKTAFKGAGGQNGVSFYNRPSKQLNAIAASLSAVAAASGSKNGSPVSAKPELQPLPEESGSSTGSVNESDEAPTVASASPAHPQIVIPRRLSLPAPQPRASAAVRRDAVSSTNGSNTSTTATSSTSTSTSTTSSSQSPTPGEEERPRLSGVKRPLSREDPERSTDALDVAQAIVVAGETIAQALLEAARLIANAPVASAAASSSTLLLSEANANSSLEAIAAKQSAQERMLKSLTESVKGSEVLLQSIAESAVNRTASEDRSRSRNGGGGGRAASGQ